jgi:AcrR family transcriptional regulator
MKRQRLSREQSREQTRESLLAAAHDVFVQKGFAHASVEEVTSAAGYSRGAFYSNFEDKTELFFELMDRESAAIKAQFRELLEAPMLDPAHLYAQLVSYYSMLVSKDTSSLLCMDAKIVALRDEKFRVRLNQFQQEQHQQIAGFIEAYTRLTGTTPSAPVDEIAIGLLALCEGVSFAHRCDPERIDANTGSAVLSYFLKSVIALPQLSAIPKTTSKKK